MKRGIGLLLLLFPFFSLIDGQDIAFDYDYDGNLTSRYVVTLRSVQTTEEEEKTEEEKTVSITLAESRISIYPNPTKGRITVSINPLDTEIENLFRLYDASGKLIETRTIVSQQTDIVITGAPGIYLLNIHLGNKISRWKIIKQ